MKTINNDKLKVILRRFESGDLWYEDGQVFRKSTGKAITSKGGRGNYIRIEVSHEGKEFRGYAHRVIFALHHGMSELEKYEVIDHIDGDVYNNHIDNLRGFTNRQNTIQGLITSGKGKKLSMEDVKEIKSLLGGDLTQKEIAKMFNVNQSHIARIKQGRHYSYI